MSILEVEAGSMDKEVEREPKFGPVGKEVFERTYARPRGNRKETFREMLHRVIKGNLELVPKKHIEANESQELFDLFFNFKALPAGRHLWMSGVKGRSFLFNCHSAGWGEQFSDHFEFMFNQLMMGGGVGASYSNINLHKYGKIKNRVNMRFICRPDHPDYNKFEHLCMPPVPTGNYSPQVAIADSREGWVSALGHLLNAYFRGVDIQITFNVSLIREEGQPIRGFGGTATGPLPLMIMLYQVADLLNSQVGKEVSSLNAMEIDHLIASCVVAGNVRRSARMATKHWMDKDIFEFIECKLDHNSHWSTNISVEIDHLFFEALNMGDRHAIEVYIAVLQGMLENGEPGFWNSSLSAEGEREPLSSPNPCGEIALNAWENCNLGHVNLSKFAHDLTGALKAHRLMARFLIRATFGDVPDPRQKEVLLRNRRIGVGHFGFQGWVNLMGIKYSECHKSAMVRKHLKAFYGMVRQECDSYCDALGIPRCIKCTTEAPTGTTSKLAGATEGIQTILFKYFINRVRFPSNHPKLAEYRAQGLNVVDDIYSANTVCVEFVTKSYLLEEVEKVWGQESAQDLVEEAADVSFEDFLAVQAMVQECYADNAISFTINLEPGVLTINDAMPILKRYLPKLKGVTLMVNGSRPLSPQEKITAEEYYSYTGEVSVGQDDLMCGPNGCPVK